MCLSFILVEKTNFLLLWLVLILVKLIKKKKLVYIYSGAAQEAGNWFWEHPTLIKNALPKVMFQYKKNLMGSGHIPKLCFFHYFPLISPNSLLHRAIRAIKVTTVIPAPITIAIRVDMLR